MPCAILVILSRVKGPTDVAGILCRAPKSQVLMSLPGLQPEILLALNLIQFDVVASGDYVIAHRLNLLKREVVVTEYQLTQDSGVTSYMAVVVSEANQPDEQQALRRCQ